MFAGSEFAKTLVVLMVFVFITNLLVACSKPVASSAAKAASGAIDKARPEKIAKAYVYAGGRCEIDVTNPAAVSSLISISRKTPLGVNGWAMNEGATKPVSPMIYAVLSNESGAYYLEGSRYPRPDVAAGNHTLDLAGFNVAGNLSHIPVGDYKLIIAMGTEFVVAMCQTTLVVRISE